MTHESRMPTVSVILVCYREGKLLQRAMESLDRQTDRNFETVVVNDASPCSETNRICQNLARRSDIRLIMRQRNGGLSAARNDGFLLSQGELCMPLDGDDELPPHAVQAVKAAAGRCPSADFYFGNYLISTAGDQAGAIVATAQLAGDDGWLCPERLLSQWGLLGTTPCRRTTWARVHGYRDVFSYDCQDADFWMRVVAGGGRGFHINEVIYQWNRADSGMNATVADHRYWELIVRNRRFQEVCGNWDAAREGFLDYVIADSIKPKVRRLMRQCGWRVLPVGSHLAGLFLRAWARSVLPARVTASLVELKQNWRKSGR